MTTTVANRVAPLSDTDDGRVRRRSPLDRRLRVALGGILVARVAVNGGLRVVYPFLAVIAAGVGVSLHTLALLVAARSLAGLAAPLLARWTVPSRWSTMMLAALVMVAAGAAAIMLAAEMSPPARIVLLIAGFAATGFARPLFELPMQAWLTTRVPLTQRGRAIGLVELGWALSLAVTVPVAGLLIGLAGWRFAFLVVLACCAAGLVAMRKMIIPAIAQTVASATVADVVASKPASQRRSPSIGDQSSRSAVAICAAAALTVAAGEMVLVTHGSWMSGTFGLSTEKIGAITVVIVLAELTGSGLVATFADRLDLRRTLLGALLASAVAAVFLGRVDDVTTAVVLLGIWFVAFETAIVSLVALATTAGIGRRAEPRVLGWMMAAMAGGNAAGASIAPLLFVDDDIHTTGLVATALGLAAAAVVVVERHWGLVRRSWRRTYAARRRDSDHRGFANGAPVSAESDETGCPPLGTQPKSEASGRQDGLEVHRATLVPRCGVFTRREGASGSVRHSADVAQRRSVVATEHGVRSTQESHGP